MTRLASTIATVRSIQRAPMLGAVTLLGLALALAPWAAEPAGADGGITSNAFQGYLPLEDDVQGPTHTASVGTVDARGVMSGRAQGVDPDSTETVTLLYEARHPVFVQDRKKDVYLEQTTHCTITVSTSGGYAGAINTGAKGEDGAVKDCSCIGRALAKNGKGLNVGETIVECPGALGSMQPVSPDGGQTDVIRGAFGGRKDVKVKADGTIKIHLVDTCDVPGPCLKDADFIVTNGLDDGAGSLRQTLADAAATPGAVIGFDKSLFGGTVALDTPLAVTADVTILGPGDTRDAVTLDGQGATRILDIDTDVVVTVANVTLTRGNETAVGNGGCIRNDGTLTLRDSVVSSCVGQFGGAIRHDGGSGDAGILTLDRVDIVDCVAESGFGGAINNNASNVVIRDSRLSRNRAAATGGGGIFNFSDGAITIERSTIDGNQANGPGGGIANIGDASASITIADSTIVGNISGGASAEGGGIFHDDGTMTIVNSTIVGNADVSNAATSGGGISLASGTLNVTNSVVASNVSGNAAQPNLDSDGINGTDVSNLIDTDPNLGALADNGGPTPTMLPLPGSPLIDAGDPAIDSDRDQRGRARVADGDRNGVALPDIGAAERL